MMNKPKDTNEQYSMAFEQFARSNNKNNNNLIGALQAANFGYHTKNKAIYGGGN